MKSSKVLKLFYKFIIRIIKGKNINLILYYIIS